MKEIIITLAAVLLPQMASAQSIENDSIVIKHPRKVTIVTSDSSQKIIVQGKEGDDDYEYRNTLQLVDDNYVSNVEINKDSWSLKSLIPSYSVTGDTEESGSVQVEIGGAPLIGFTAPTHCDPGTNFSTFRSWEFALPFINSTVFFENNKKYHSSGLSLETYFNWRNYRMTGDTRFVKNSSGNVELAPYPKGAKPKFSRVKVFSVSGALLVFHTFKDWGIAVGPVVNFNTYASLKTRYSIDGGKYKDVEKNINQRKVTFDIMGIIQTPAVDLYLKYSPNSVLKDGVKFRSLTFGFAL